MSVLLLLVAGAGGLVGLCVGVVYHDGLVEAFRRIHRRRAVLVLPSGNPYRDPTAVGVVMAQAIEHAAQQPPGGYLYWNAHAQQDLDDAEDAYRESTDRLGATVSRLSATTKNLEEMERPLGRYHDIVGADLGESLRAKMPLVPAAKWVCPVCDNKAEPETASLGDSLNARPTAICTPDNHRPDCAERFPYAKRRPTYTMEAATREAATGGQSDMRDMQDDLAWMQQAVVAALLHNQRPHLHLHCSSCGHRWTVTAAAADLALRR